MTVFLVFCNPEGRSAATASGSRGQGRAEEGAITMRPPYAFGSGASNPTSHHPEQLVHLIPSRVLAGARPGARSSARRRVAAFAVVLAWAASAGAKTVVVGTGDPDIDVPAVQAAVDQGGNVILKGHFSFDRPPTITPPPPP